MIVRDYEELPKIREEQKDEVIVFCSGVFDVTHAGHILFFEDCKKQGDILVVLVANDATIRKYKGGKRPILNEEIRLKTIDSFKPVDYCLIDKFVPKDNKEFNSFKAIIDIFKKLNPNKWAINKDAFNIPLREKISKDMNIKLITLERWCPKEFENISTSNIIEKIKKLD